MKRVLPGVVLIAVLLAVAIALRSRDKLPQTPEDAVSELFDAAGRGDDAAYLRVVCGELRKTLAHSRSQLGPKEFRQSLCRSVSGLKGLAVSRADDSPGDLVALDVELVFIDRNERQRMLVAQQRTGWAVAAIEKATMVKPSIPYGTPVFE